MWIEYVRLYNIEPKSPAREGILKPNNSDESFVTSLREGPPMIDRSPLIIGHPLANQCFD